MTNVAQGLGKAAALKLKSKLKLKFKLKLKLKLKLKTTQINAKNLLVFCCLKIAGSNEI